VTGAPERAPQAAFKGESRSIFGNQADFVGNSPRFSSMESTIP